MTSPLESLGILLTEEERAEVLDSAERRAIEESENDQPASLPSREHPMGYGVLALAHGVSD